MPKNHPLTTAVLLNLSQRNAQEIQQLLGGAPSFFPDWGNVVLHTGPNGARSRVLDFNAARAAPGSNALLEALGQGGFNLHTLTAPFQPIAGALASSFAGQNPLTGRASHDPWYINFAKQMVSSAATASPAQPPDRLPQSPYTELFNKITGSKGSLGEYLAPNPLVDPRKEQEAAASLT
jgi:hypothetical protein